MFIKYFVSPCFKRGAFADMLNNIGIDAVAVEDGVILARTAFNAIPSGQLPVWAWLNKADINSPLHTRPATWEDLEPVIDRFAFPTEWDTEEYPIEREDSRPYPVPTDEDMREMEFAFYNDELYRQGTAI